MRLILVRHGQSVGNAEERLQGRRDYPLTALGRHQASRLGQIFKAHGLRFDAVYVSPLGRALETLNLMARSLLFPAPQPRAELAEIAFGRLEGLRRQDLAVEAPEFLERGIQDLADYGDFGGETYAAVQERVQAFKGLLFERHWQRRDSVLVVGHGGLNFQLAKSLVCVPVPRVCLLKMTNCSATCIQMVERRGSCHWGAPLARAARVVGSRTRASTGGPCGARMVWISFDAGTIEVGDLTASDAERLSLTGILRWDARTRRHRAKARHYADVVLTLTAAGVPFEDRARAYQSLQLSPLIQREPRPFQREALNAWRQAHGRGVVVLPTGAGKSHVALMAIADRKRSALVVAPTLDLVRQWYDTLRLTFGCPVGLVAGGHHELLDLTVTTYDSAAMHMGHFGHRFGLVIFDECHHLPGPTYSLAASWCLAPYRLGLTATPERADGKEALLCELIGEVVYEKAITDLSGKYLAEYETERIAIELSPEERAEYEEERAVYLTYLRSQKLAIRSPRDFSAFIQRASRTRAGQRALTAYRRQRELATASPRKLEYLAHLLDVHAADQVLIFTQDNGTAYRISRQFLIPAMTHQTKVRERSQILERFGTGTYGAVVTPRVLNEGVDVPDASVAIVVSGTGSVREHVQRLGRILRKKEGKRSVLYELVSANTNEAATSERRREHIAYQ